MKNTEELDTPSQMRTGDYCWQNQLVADELEEVWCSFSASGARLDEKKNTLKLSHSIAFDYNLKKYYMQGKK